MKTTSVDISVASCRSLRQWVSVIGNSGEKYGATKASLHPRTAARLWNKLAKSRSMTARPANRQERLPRRTLLFSGITGRLRIKSGVRTPEGVLRLRVPLNEVI